MLLPLLVPLAPLPFLLKFAPKISAVGSPSAQEDRGLLPGLPLLLLPALLLLQLLLLLLLLLLRSYALLAGEMAELAAAVVDVLNAARGLPQPAVMVQVPS